jgi:5-methylcytosine-specific restriction enzyme A
MVETLNFGHEIYPSEEDDTYIGYTPLFNRPPSINNGKDVEIIFLMSSDYRNDNRKCIVGFYGFPEFGEWYQRTAKHKKFTKYVGGNIKSDKNDIVYFKNPVVIDTENVIKLNLIPVGKKIGQQGFNYLNSDNVINILNLAVTKNPKNEDLRYFLTEFPLFIEKKIESNETEQTQNIISVNSADTLTDILKLEKKMLNLKPRVRERISIFIERGSIASKIKTITGFKCLICEKMGQNPLSFKKTNGEYYVETHHVEPVANLKKGSLGVANLLTLCANHHRQMHYGNVQTLENTDECFKFLFDNKELIVKKIKVTEEPQTQG